MLDTFARGADVLVPWHWHMEVAHRLLQWRRSHAMSKTRFDEAARILGELPVNTDPFGQELYVATVLERAITCPVQAFDMPYLDLALDLDLPIATLDGGLAAAARRLGVEVLQP